SSPGPAAMRVEPRTLNFSSPVSTPPAAQQFRVSNVGGTPLHWALALGNASTFSAAPQSGLLAPGDSAAVTVAVAAIASQPTSYARTIGVVSPEASSQEVSVSVTFTPPPP